MAQWTFLISLQWILTITDSHQWNEWALLIYPTMSVSWLSARLSPHMSFVNSIDSYLSSQNRLPNLKRVSCFQGKLCNLSSSEKLFNKLGHQITHEFSCYQMLSMVILLNMSLFSKRCPQSPSDFPRSAATRGLRNNGECRFFYGMSKILTPKSFLFPSPNQNRWSWVAISFGSFPFHQTLALFEKPLPLRLFV